MSKININSIKFKIYFLFIATNIIVFSIGIFLTVHYIALYNRKFLKERLKSSLMTETMEFGHDRHYMLEKANDIVAHNFKSGFIKKIFYSQKGKWNKKISSVVLIRIKKGKTSYIKKFKYNNKIKSLSVNNNRFKRIIRTQKRYVFTGFGRDKSDRLIELKVIYRIVRNKTGYIIILNRDITNDYLRNISLKNHINANLGVYYGNKRSAISIVRNNKYQGLGQSATKKQILVLKYDKNIYTSIIVNGAIFYIYNKPIKNYEGRIIGILGAGIGKYRWFWYISKLYIPIFFFICLLIFSILIFIFINKKFSYPFYDLLRKIEKIDPNNPKKLDLTSKYQNRESEFYEFAKAITVLNDAIIKKQQENNLIVSYINHFSKTVSNEDDLNSITLKLINLIVEKMGYSYSWFGILNESDKDIKIINAYNNDFSYIKNLILKYDDSKYSQNMISRAIKSQNYEAINDIEKDENFPLYKGRLLEYKFLSIGAFPLITQGRIIGVLAVYSSKKNELDVIKAGIIFNLTNYVSYLIIYLQNLKRSLTLSKMAEKILFLMTTVYEKAKPKPEEPDEENEAYIKEFLNNIEKNLKTDFVEFIVYDGIKDKITEAIFSSGWDYNIGVSSIAPTSTLFVQKRIAENRLDAYDYQEDEFATEVYKNIGVRDIILYAFDGTKGKRYLAVTGSIKRKMEFYSEDLDFFRDGVNLSATYFEISLLFEKLDSSLRLLENRQNLINKMVAFGVVSVNLIDKVVSLYNDYFSEVFKIDKFSVPISLDEFYENIKPAFEDENLAYNIFETYIKNRYVTTIEDVKINLKGGIILSMKSNLFSLRSNEVIRLLVFENITESINYIKNLEGLNKRLNLLNDLSYKLSMVFSLEYAIKTFAEGICSIKNEKEGEVDSLHINIFDTISKKTVTSLIYSRKENGISDTGSSEKVLLFKNNIDYKDYSSNCELLKNSRKKDDSVIDCEFRGTEGSYICFSLKISDEVVGTVSVDSKTKDFFTEDITSLIKEIINIASPVFAKLLLIETNKELAITDALTGIYNRRYMYEFAKREIVKAYRNKTYLSLVIIDIDKFKDVNDNYGHQAGDYVLKELVRDFKSVLMRGQDIITRYGGDEFVMILPDTDKQKTVELMEKLKAIIKNKTYIVENNVSLIITLSIGVAGIEYPLDENIVKNKDKNIGEDILNYLLRTADDNLYKAKDLGRDRVV